MLLNKLGNPTTENQFDLTGEYARSDLDVRHRFIFSPVYETGTFTRSDNRVLRALLSDYVFTGIFQAQSGIAYSGIVGGDPSGDGVAGTDRVPGTVRNQFSTPAAFIVDMRVGRIIRFEAPALRWAGLGFQPPMSHIHWKDGRA